MPASESVRGPAVVVTGWALDADGHPRASRAASTAAHSPRTLRRAARRRRRAARRRIPRRRERRASPRRRPRVDAGRAPGIDRRTLTVVAIASDGRETVLGTRSLIEPAALERWRAVRRRTARALLPAARAVRRRARRRRGLDTHYAPLPLADDAHRACACRSSTCARPAARRTTTRSIPTGTSSVAAAAQRAAAVRRFARRRVRATRSSKRLPMLFTLNGGIWADAACDAPEWDVNDQLEQDTANCQWNEKNEVMPDDYLKNLPGAFETPRARALADVQRLREGRAPLQEAQPAAGGAASSSHFAREHPELFVGVNLDPDTYLNPFFDEQQWFDYNPGTLRQFRQWLAGTGPYAGRPEPGVPDLSAYRRAKPLLARRGQPPRRAPLRALGRRRSAARVSAREGRRRRSGTTRGCASGRRSAAISCDLHYDELSQWLVEAGIPRRRIWSSQGFMAPHRAAMPFALHVTTPDEELRHRRHVDRGREARAGPPRRDPLRRGGAERHPHGRTAVAVRDASRASTPVGRRRVQHGRPAQAEGRCRPTRTAYRGLRDMWNYGARYVSPMAWNGSNGALRRQAGLRPVHRVAQHAARGGRARLPARARAPAPGAGCGRSARAGIADGDGWTAERGALVAAPGARPADAAMRRRDGCAGLAAASCMLGATRALARRRAGRSARRRDRCGSSGRAAKDAPWRALAVGAAARGDDCRPMARRHRRGAHRARSSARCAGRARASRFRRSRRIDRVRRCGYARGAERLRKRALDAHRRSFARHDAVRSQLPGSSALYLDVGAVAHLAHPILERLVGLALADRRRACSRLRSR